MIKKRTTDLLTLFDFQKSHEKPIYVGRGETSVFSR